MEAQLLDPHAVDEARALFKHKFPTMAGYYFEDSEGYIANIRDAVAARDVSQIVTPAHTLKSSSRQMGAALVSGLAKDIEATARAQVEAGTADMNDFTTMLSRLEQAFSDTRNAYPDA
ncbi:Hpt domain-containing protein [Asticcacaulis sp. AND118]|uniref:Hpt domain-containing protein n=1 Tax=Asticcacaulis sp. AND118 TaxID=2840468 RepID=UPI001CFFC47E|nr:Hpt domain-containing protein [Asticcacaulis sp. AND118]UDF05738.1 Hpt domain-containing protein [Asticcacaulis sp. AND118]